VCEILTIVLEVACAWCVISTWWACRSDLCLSGMATGSGRWCDLIACEKAPRGCQAGCGAGWGEFMTILEEGSPEFGPRSPLPLCLLLLGLTCALAPSACEAACTHLGGRVEPVISLPQLPLTRRMWRVTSFTSLISCQPARGRQVGCVSKGG
jgi:hypothetical protein